MDIEEEVKFSRRLCFAYGFAMGFFIAGCFVPEKKERKEKLHEDYITDIRNKLYKLVEWDCCEDSEDKSVFDISFFSYERNSRPVVIHKGGEPSIFNVTEFNVMNEGGIDFIRSEVELEANIMDNRTNWFNRKLIHHARPCPGIPSGGTLTSRVYFKSLNEDLLKDLERIELSARFRFYHPEGIAEFPLEDFAVYQKQRKV